jgi:hypothetical protein
VTAQPGDDRGVATTLLLIRCGIVAGPLFVAAFLVEGATRSGYSPLRHPVSSLALGESGWTQVLNFLVAGALYVAFAAGPLRAGRQGGTAPRVGALLIGAVAVGLLGAGTFVTDPVSGYPPGTPDALTSYSTSGALHDGFSVGTFVGLPAAALTFAWFFWRRKPRVGGILDRHGVGVPRRLRSYQRRSQPGPGTGRVRGSLPAHHGSHRLQLADAAGNPHQ